MTDPASTAPEADGPLDYEELAETFGLALLHTLRNHNVADSYLDYWVPDADPILGISSMLDSARIAGRDELEIRFRRTTVPLQRQSELEASVAEIGDVSFREDGTAIILCAVRMTSSKANQTGAPRKKNERSSGPRDTNRASRTAGGVTQITAWDTGDLPAFGDVHPDYRAGLDAVIQAGLTHQSFPPNAGENEILLSGKKANINLHMIVDIASGLVRAARHSGAESPSDLAIFDLFCRMSESLPLQEATDHVVLKIIDSLIDDERRRPVQGVVLPANSGAPFSLPAHLSRLCYKQFMDGRDMPAETNFYTAPPSLSWLAHTSEIRWESVQSGIKGFLQSAILYPDDIELLRLENNKSGYEVRAVVCFADRIETPRKPSLMRQLEHRLRRDVEKNIELVVERVKDASPLRRLS